MADVDPPATSTGVPADAIPESRVILSVSSAHGCGEHLWSLLPMGGSGWLLSRTRDRGSSREAAGARVAQRRGAQSGWCPISMGPNAGVLCVPLCFTGALLTAVADGTQWPARAPCRRVGTLPEPMRRILLFQGESVFLTLAETVGCCLISTFPLPLEHNTLCPSGGSVPSQRPSVTDLK